MYYVECQSEHKNVYIRMPKLGLVICEEFLYKTDIYKLIRS